MRDDRQSDPAGSEGNEEELERVVEDFSASLVDILLPLHPVDCTCSGCPGNDGRSVSFQDLARYVE
jgi:hypothetical protein